MPSMYISDREINTFLARNHASQLAQMKQAFALHPLLQQALILQADLQQKQQLAQTQTKEIEVELF